MKFKIGHIQKARVYTFKQHLSRIKKRLLFYSIALIVFIIAFIVVFANVFYSQSKKYFDNIAITRITNTGNLTEDGVSLYLDHCFHDLENFKADLAKSDIKTSDTIDMDKLYTYLASIHFDYHLDYCGVLYQDEVIFSNEDRFSIEGTNLPKEIQGNYIFPYSDGNFYFGIPTTEAFPEFKGIVGKISAQEFSKEIEVHVYNDEANQIIVEENGDIISVSSVHHEDWYGTNFFDDVQKQYSKSDLNKLKSWLTDPTSSTLAIGRGKGKWECMLFKKPLEYGDQKGAYIFVLAVPMKLLTNQVVSLSNISLAALYTSLIIGTSVIILLAVLLVRNHIKSEEKKAYGPKSGLLNEDYFFHDMQAILFHDDSPFGLVAMNIKGFKNINSIYGADIADELLVTIGKAVNDYFKDKEDDIAGYQRGDNYMLLLKGNEDDVLYKLTTLDYELNQIDFLGNMKVTFSYGIKITSSKFALELHQELDKAKFAEKVNSHAEDNYFFFNEEMEKRQKEADEMNNRFEEALEKKEFEVFFQLKWNLKKNDWGGAEALVRWRSPERGLIPPGKFIPLYEENGNIVELDAYVFERTCQLLSEMLDKGERVVPISINLSKRNFANMSFMPLYQSIVEKYKIPHELIEFEITEGLLMDNVESYTKFIRIFHENDYGIAMDDFGAGYSSLNMIHKLDFDIIKIDAKFFRDGFDDSNKTIVKSVISLCHKLGKTVVAEGIEHSYEVDFLKEAKCDIIQGYYFAKPLPFEDFKVLLSQKTESEENKGSIAG